MKSALDLINGILEEELDFLTDGKRNIVAQRIVDTLRINNMQILSLEELKKEPSTYPENFEEKISQKENELILGKNGGGMGFAHKIEQIKNFDKHVN